MMVRRCFHLLLSSLIVYCITSNNVNVIVVVNAVSENEDAVDSHRLRQHYSHAVEVDENNAAGNNADDGVVVPVVVPFMTDDILSCRNSTVSFFYK